MDIVQSQKEKEKKFWVSITGYRAFIVLRALMQKNHTSDELIDILKNNNITQKAVSKDTIRVTINTLKSAGCVISKPNKSNNFEYRLTSHPFNINFSENELLALNALREKYGENSNWQSILKVDELYSKIIALTNDIEQITYIKSSSPLNKIKIDILREISSQKLIGKKIQIEYKSAEKNEKENIDIVPNKIIYEDKKLYLQCYIYKYQTMTFLDVSRILKIKTVYLEKPEENKNIYEVIYTVEGNSLLEFELKDYEKIIDKTTEKLTIKANVTNEFWFIQRLLLLGRDFKIISPDSFRAKLINKIKLIQQEYK